MESGVNIKAGIKEVEEHFEKCPNENWNIRYYDFGGKTTTCKAIIRHVQLKENLTGCFTIAELDNIFQQKKEEDKK